MSVAIRAITRVQDADDFGSTPGAGNDGYALTWDNGAGEFVLTAAGGGGVTDHGALSGLSDDDHSQYLLATGARTGASSQAQAFTTGISIGPSTQTITFNNTDVANTLLGSIDFKNNNNVVARIAADERNSTGGSYGGCNDADLVFSTALNGSLTEKFRIPRSGYLALGTALNLTAQGTGTGNENTFISGDNYNVLTLNARRNFVFASPVLGQVAAIGGDQNFATYLRKSTDYTNSAIDMLVLRHATSGTAAAGLGGNLRWQLETSTTEDTQAAKIAAIWYEATHATRKADLVLTAYDTAEREGLRIRGAGSAPAIGFYGVTPIERATLATGAGASVDDVITALQNLGLVKQS